MTIYFQNQSKLGNWDLKNSTDIEIFNYSKKNDYAIVTFDSDFCDLNIFWGYPPKIIWIRTGNTTTKNLENLLRNQQELIKLFLTENYGCLEIVE